VIPEVLAECELCAMTTPCRIRKEGKNGSVWEDVVIASMTKYILFSAISPL